MSVTLRFKRVGKPKNALYRVVAIDKRQRSQGTPIEILGHYNPKQGAKSITVDVERCRYWISQGAKPSESFKGTLKSAGFWAQVNPSKTSS